MNTAFIYTERNQTEPDAKPLAFIATHRYRGILAYGIRLHWNGQVSWHWGGMRHTQPSELQMFGLLRVLSGLSPPMKLRAILFTDYLTACLVMAAKRKRDAERGIFKRRSREQDEYWFQAVAYWQTFGGGMREGHTNTEKEELRFAERQLKHLLYAWPSPFGIGDTLVEGGDPLPFTF